MKICIIAPVVIPVLGRDQKYGGIELVVSLAADEMVRRGHEVILFASGDSRSDAKIVATTPKALGQGFSFDQEKECNELAFHMAVAEKPDVIWDNTMAVHAHEMIQNRSTFLFRADIAFHKENMVDTGDIPIVQTLHGPAKDHLPGLVSDLSAAGHYFVSISKDQARRYLELIPDLRHLGTVYNAVDTNFYKVNPKKKSDYLIWVGRYCMEKGPHIALEVAHRIDMPIKFLGKMVEKHEIDYFEKFIKPNLTDRDEVMPEVTAEEKAAAYAGAKATMMTNLWPEPFGLVVAESMASGTPVVGPALGSLTELIDTAGVLIPIEDLGLDENDPEVTESQEKYIDRIVRYMKRIDKIPPAVPRKRAEFLFSAKHNVDGYEEAFYKAMYLKEEEIHQALYE